MEIIFELTKDAALWILDNLVFINIILSIIIIFFQRRNPTAVWTWLLVLYFIPIVGFILYLVVGQDYRKSKMFPDFATFSILTTEKYIENTAFGLYFFTSML